MRRRRTLDRGRAADTPVLDMPRGARTATARTPPKLRIRAVRPDYRAFELPPCSHSRPPEGATMGGMPVPMFDHPGWTSSATARLRSFGSNDGAWAVSASLSTWQVHGRTDDFKPEPEVFHLAALPPQLPESLTRSLNSLGPVARWKNPDLWDAIATTIIRQVIRAGQARILHQRFCAAYGSPVDTPHGIVHSMPDAAHVMDLPAEAFTAVGMAFKRRPLQAAAEAYLLHGAKWADLPPARLAEELQTVPRIGPWTAGAAAADFTHDWGLYPYGDLAVRKWAAVAAPDIDWPGKEDAFAERWRTITADQLGPLTLLTLAWGANHGGTP